MDFNALQGATNKAFRDYTRQTNLEPKPEFLQIHVHPDDLAEIRVSAKRLYFDIQGYLDDKGVLGIPLVMDDTVERGHPEIRSTWKWVL